MKTFLIMVVLALFLSGCWPYRNHMQPQNGQRMQQNSQMGYGSQMQY